MFAMTGGCSGLPLEDTDGTWAEPPLRAPVPHPTPWSHGQSTFQADLEQSCSFLNSLGGQSEAQSKCSGKLF